MVLIPNRVRVLMVVSALALAAGLLTLAVVLAKPAQAQAQPVTSTDRDTFSFSAGGCPPLEEVFIEGTLRTVAHTTIDENGGYHTKIQTDLKGQGEGLDSGDKYVYHYVNNYHENYSLAMNENFNITETFIVNMIRQGSDTTTDDFQTKLVFNFTVNANGEVTAEVYNYEIGCI